LSSDLRHIDMNHLVARAVDDESRNANRRQHVAHVGVPGHFLSAPRSGLEKVRDDHLGFFSVESVALAKCAAEHCLFRPGAPR
jgi:hypothetical protein